MIICGSLDIATKLLRRKKMASEIYQCHGCSSVLHDDDLIICEDIDSLHKGCPFCCTDSMLMDIDTMEEDNDCRR
jgi:hypothetical protein